MDLKIIIFIFLTSTSARPLEDDREAKRQTHFQSSSSSSSSFVSGGPGQVSHQSASVMVSNNNNGQVTQSQHHVSGGGFGNLGSFLISSSSINGQKPHTVVITRNPITGEVIKKEYDGASGNRPKSAINPEDDSIQSDFTAIKADAFDGQSDFSGGDFNVGQGQGGVTNSNGLGQANVNGQKESSNTVNANLPTKDAAMGQVSLPSLPAKDAVMVGQISTPTLPAKDVAMEQVLSSTPTKDALIGQASSSSPSANNAVMGQVLPSTSPAKDIVMEQSASSTSSTNAAVMDQVLSDESIDKTIIPNKPLMEEITQNKQVPPNPDMASNVNLGQASVGSVSTSAANSQVNQPVEATENISAVVGGEQSVANEGKITGINNKSVESPTNSAGGEKIATNVDNQANNQASLVNTQVDKLAEDKTIVSTKETAQNVDGKPSQAQTDEKLTQSKLQSSTGAVGEAVAYSSSFINAEKQATASDPLPGRLTESKELASVNQDSKFAPGLSSVDQIASTNSAATQSQQIQPPVNPSIVSSPWNGVKVKPIILTDNPLMEDTNAKTEMAKVPEKQETQSGTSSTGEVTNQNAANIPNSRIKEKPVAAVVISPLVETVENTKPVHMADKPALGSDFPEEAFSSDSDSESTSATESVKEEREATDEKPIMEKLAISKVQQGVSVSSISSVSVNGSPAKTILTSTNPTTGEVSQTEVKSSANPIEGAVVSSSSINGNRPLSVSSISSVSVNGQAKTTVTSLNSSTGKLTQTQYETSSNLNKNPVAATLEGAKQVEIITSKGKVTQSSADSLKEETSVTSKRSEDPGCSSSANKAKPTPLALMYPYYSSKDYYPPTFITYTNPATGSVVKTAYLNPKDNSHGFLTSKREPCPSDDDSDLYYRELSAYMDCYYPEQEDEPYKVYTTEKPYTSSPSEEDSWAGGDINKFYVKRHVFQRAADSYHYRPKTFYIINNFGGW